MSQDFTKKQIKTIIEKLFYVSQKNNYVIKLNDLESAATLAVYLAGFPSLKSYQESLKHSHSDKKIIPANKQRKPTTCNEEIIESLIKQQPQQEENTPAIQESKPIPCPIIIGTTYNHITKQKQNHILQITNTLFDGDENSIFDNTIQTLKTQNQSIIEIKEGAFSIHKINPLEHISKNPDFLDTLLNINPENINEIDFIWSNIIKDLVISRNIKPTIEFLIDSTSLSFLKSMGKTFYSNNHFLGKIITSYLNKHNLTETNNEEAHNKNIQHITNLLYAIEQEYENDNFSETGTTFIEAMLSKKQISFLFGTKNKNLSTLIEKTINEDLKQYIAITNNQEHQNHKVFISIKDEIIEDMNALIRFL